MSQPGLRIFASRSALYDLHGFKFVRFVSQTCEKMISLTDVPDRTQAIIRLQGAQSLSGTIIPSFSDSRTQCVRDLQYEYG
eukprot:scaffold161621_cov29-Prasinocladus_malaysianus.AAC.1